MITVKQACNIVLSARQNKDIRIHCVNEFKDVFMVVTVPVDWKRGTPMNRGIVEDLVDKNTGKYETSTLLDERLQGDFKGYTAEDIAKM